MKSKIDRITSGIPGLDKLIGGGFIRGQCILLCGTYGTGKTTFALQYLVEGAKKGEPGLFITFEEGPSQLEQESKSYGWDIDKLEAEKKFKILSMPARDLLNMVEAGYGQVNDLITNMKVQRVVIDTIVAFELLGDDEYERRKYILDFVAWLKKKGCTAILTMDVEPGSNIPHKSGIAESATDGIIVLYHPKEKNKRERSLEVLKMRGTEHTDKTLPFKISNKGLYIKKGK